MFEPVVTEILPKIEFVESRNDTKQPSVMTLSGGFSTGGAHYRFEIKADGTGTIFYSDYGSDSEDFAHECDFKTLGEEIEAAVELEIESLNESLSSDKEEIEKIRRNIATEKLEEVFWEEINERLEDPFFRSFYDDKEWGEEFQTTCGTVAEFIEFLELCVLTEREIVAGNDDYLVVEAETETSAAGISECGYYSERLESLVEIACDYFQPNGFRYDYNDGCYDRYSGYSMSSESVSVPLHEFAGTPAREKMLGMIRLKRKLAEMQVKNDVIENLTVC